MTSDMDLGSFYKQFVEFRATLTKQGHPIPEDKRESAEIPAEARRSILGHDGINGQRNATGSEVPEEPSESL
jgi:hypothetical protein